MILQLRFYVILHLLHKLQLLCDGGLGIYVDLHVFLKYVVATYIAGVWHIQRSSFIINWPYGKSTQPKIFHHHPANE
jgi:hypothetical protein